MSNTSEEMDDTCVYCGRDERIELVEDSGEFWMSCDCGMGSAIHDAVQPSCFSTKYEAQKDRNDFVILEDNGCGAEEKFRATCDECGLYMTSKELVPYFKAGRRVPCLKKSKLK